MLFAPEIFLNKALLDKTTYTDTVDKYVVAHETGHALGLGDHYKGYEKLLMYGYTQVGNVTTPQRHDKEDYNSLWKK